MLCEVCQGIFIDPAARLPNDYGYPDMPEDFEFHRSRLTFKHHTSQYDLQEAAEYCFVCAALWKSLSDMWAIYGDDEADPEWSDTDDEITDVDEIDPMFMICWLKLRDGVDGFVMKFARPFPTDKQRQTEGMMLSEFHLLRQVIGMPEERLNTSTENLYPLAQDWMLRCFREHESCRSAGDSKWHPTRLLDLKSVLLDHPSPPHLVHLIRTENNPSIMNHGYISLSHCWGKDHFLRLTRETESLLYNSGVPLNEFPKTFQDTLRFASRLKIRYVWIDSLCIQQDSEADWLFESGRMLQVYQNALLNISATACSSPFDGLFSEHIAPEVISLKAAVNLHEKAERTIGVHGNLVFAGTQWWDANVESGSVNRRAWVFQERLIAPRVLHFCSGRIAWECRELNATEDFPTGNSELAGKLLHAKSFKDQMSASRLSLHPDLNNDACLRQWRCLLEYYSRLALTRGTDKLIAISGVARALSDWISGEYYAGLWRWNLERNLLWQAVLVRPRPSLYQAPSWSWACLSSSIRYESPGNLAEEYGPLAFKVEQCELMYRSNDIYHGVSGGHLILTGELMAIRLDHLGGGKEGVLKNRPFMTSWGIMCVHLDSPQSDGGTLFDAGEGMCVLLKARVQEKPIGGGHSRFLILRVVKDECRGTYRRLGILDNIRTPWQRGINFFEGESFPLSIKWNSTSRLHRIRVI